MIVFSEGGHAMRILLFTAATAVALLSLGSCATMSEDQCLAGAWGERGYADGAAGLPTSRLDDHAKACAAHGVTPDAAVYFSARESGLTTYCTPQQGFRAGREGDVYAGVCPAPLEDDFLPAYEDGRVIHGVEQALSSARTHLDSLARRIEDLDDKLDAKNSELRQDGLTEDQRDQVRNRIREIRQEREDRIRDWRRAEYDLDDAEDRARDVRYRFAGRYGGW